MGRILSPRLPTKIYRGKSEVRPINSLTHWNVIKGSLSLSSAGASQAASGCSQGIRDHCRIPFNQRQQHQSGTVRGSATLLPIAQGA